MPAQAEQKQNERTLEDLSSVNFNTPLSREELLNFFSDIKKENPSITLRYQSRGEIITDRVVEFTPSQENLTGSLWSPGNDVWFEGEYASQSMCGNKYSGLKLRIENNDQRKFVENLKIHEIAAGYTPR